MYRSADRENQSRADRKNVTSLPVLPKHSSNTYNIKGGGIRPTTQDDIGDCQHNSSNYQKVTSRTDRQQLYNKVRPTIKQTETRQPRQLTKTVKMTYMGYITKTLAK
jgi:hypothetical protein